MCKQRGGGEKEREREDGRGKGACLRALPDHKRPCSCAFKEQVRVFGRRGTDVPPTRCHAWGGSLRLRPVLGGAFPQLQCACPVRAFGLRLVCLWLNGGRPLYERRFRCEFVGHAELNRGAGCGFQHSRYPVDACSLNVDTVDRQQQRADLEFRLRSCRRAWLYHGNAELRLRPHRTGDAQAQAEPTSHGAGEYDRL